MIIRSLNTSYMGASWKLCLTLRILEFTSHQIHHGACKPTNVKTRRTANSGPEEPWIVLEIIQGFSTSNTRVLLSSVMPNLKKDWAKLEKVQRRAFRYALRNTGQDISYEERLKILKWPTLHQRGLISSLTECCKKINSLNGLDQFDYFTFAREFRPLRANHCHKLKALPAKLNSFKYSFFINVVNNWNNLP